LDTKVGPARTWSNHKTLFFLSSPNYAPLSHYLNNNILRRRHSSPSFFSHSLESAERSCFSFALIASSFDKIQRRALVMERSPTITP
jgi:hypothetical protein